MLVSNCEELETVAMNELGELGYAQFPVSLSQFNYSFNHRNENTTKRRIVT